ncbi:amiloride-sensitive sodium channel subunit gamma isoform X2 [Hyla sarda]|nr:amiloride-sensitive sodium channel subunit gamma isoform X2 [Hyla sarda]XP_056389936.1 amiloride-sensitive sodium channel subunit gamma isoform X2 [Hyla sarda]XP_056389937.1 amiloride-sensitive sodium channel subunit gamma isoform X2 [Hyla sarda]XP_056389938.1 amiloride-sensitive sodium channel subunit gamma isoform X2 [Hyla sarda]
MSNGPKKKITQKLKKTLPVTGPQAPTLYELMQWYCLTTNTHGCRRIVVSKGRIRKWIWIVLTLIAVALIFWQCALLLMSYYTVSVSITVNFQKLTFPAVTVCNMNPYRYSSMNKYLSGLEAETIKALREIYGYTKPPSRRRRDAEMPQEVTEEQFNYLNKIQLFEVKSIRGNEIDMEEIPTRKRSRMNARVVHRTPETTAGNIVGYKLCDLNNSSDCTIFTFSSAINAIQEWYRLHYMNILAKIPMEEKILMGYSADELLINCFFDGKTCDARNFTLFQHPLYGNCYTFNDAQRKNLLDSSMGGAEAGLKLVIYMDEEEYNPFLVTAAGAKILVHDQNDFPFIEESGTELETGTETSIGMQLTESSKLSSPYSDCTIDGNDVPVENLYNKKYTYQICLYSCFQNEMVKTCGCAHYDQPLPKGAKYCNYDEFPSWIYCYFKLHKQFVQEELGCQSTCRESCSFKEWTFTRSVAKWPSLNSEEWTLRVLSWELGSRLHKNLTKNDLANLDIFYQDLNLRTIAESPASSLSNLLANFGGQLGLWMSCSMVCVLEIVEIFLVDSLWVVLRQKWHKFMRWWRSRKEGKDIEQHRDTGHDNPCLSDEDPPTFNTALQLPHAEHCQVPRTPPPLYRSLQIQSDIEHSREDENDIEIEQM